MQEHFWNICLTGSVQNIKKRLILLKYAEIFLNISKNPQNSFKFRRIYLYVHIYIYNKICIYI